MSSPENTWGALKSSNIGFTVGLIVDTAAIVGGIITGISWFQGLITDRLAVLLAGFAFLLILIHIEIQLWLLQRLVRDESPRVKHDLLEKKYHLHFKDWKSVIDLKPEEVDAIKLRLMDGVQHKVYAIHRVEDFLPLPQQRQDDKNYFEKNRDAFKRIRDNHRDPGDRSEYTIHRIFIVSKEGLKVPGRGQKIRERIQKHCDEGFDVRVAFTEELKAVPAWEFAIYDEEIVLRLEFNNETNDYGVGSVYSDKFQVDDRYPKLYEVIEAQSSKPDEDFWKEHLAPST